MMMIWSFMLISITQKIKKNKDKERKEEMMLQKKYTCWGFAVALICLVVGIDCAASVNTQIKPRICRGLLHHLERFLGCLDQPDVGPDGQRVDRQGQWLLHPEAWTRTAWEKIARAAFCLPIGRCLLIAPTVSGHRLSSWIAAWGTRSVRSLMTAEHLRHVVIFSTSARDRVDRVAKQM